MWPYMSHDAGYICYLGDSPCLTTLDASLFQPWHLCLIQWTPRVWKRSMEHTRFDQDALTGVSGARRMCMFLFYKRNVCKFFPTIISERSVRPLLTRKGLNTWQSSPSELERMSLHGCLPDCAKQEEGSKLGQGLEVCVGQCLIPTSRFVSAKN